MQTITSKEVDEKIGKSGFFSKSKTVNLGYYFAGIDELETDSKLKTIADFEKRPNGLAVRFMEGFKRKWLAIPDNEIYQIKMDDKAQEYEVEEKSVVGRAILGGILLGPAGAIVGGMSGLKNGLKKSEMSDLGILISCEEGTFVIMCKYKNKKTAMDFFQKHYHDKFEIQL